MFHFFVDAFKGPSQARAAHRQALLKNPGIRTGISCFQNACPIDIQDDPEKPIFILSAGWRSGSTLLQRLIMSDKRILIWGEPLDECGIIQALADTMKAFRNGWPPAEYFYDGSPANTLTGEWIANLFPSLNAIRISHRTFFDKWLLEPAKASGAEQWGIKEVRLDTDHCHYLRWLYPNARFLFLYRNPFDAYASYCSYGRSWYDTFPDKPIFTPTSFGTHWKTLMEGFLRDAEEFDALLIKYEDLIEGKMCLDRLEEHLNIRIDHSVLQKKVGGASHNRNIPKVNCLEKFLLKKAVAPIAKRLEYYP